MIIYLNQLGLVCSLGSTLSEIKHNLFTGKSGIQLTDRYSPGRVLPLGCLTQADAALPKQDQLPLRDRSRNNQIALAALEQIRPAVDAAIERFGADRIGVIIGTSTSGIAEGEHAVQQHAIDGTLPKPFHYGQQEMGSPATALAKILNVYGPAYTHSSACASSAKAMASAARLIKMGICDAVITGGVDSLCRFTVAGFSSLELTSDTRCNPLSTNRNGINIGEGAALFLMSAQPATVALRGWGESSDAHHISAPDPAGIGARLAIEQALARADITAQQIEYINLHGTATVQNDAMECQIINTLFGSNIPVSSTKGFTGHALGAASAIEAGLCWLAMQDENKTGLLPPHLWDGMPDPVLPSLTLTETNFSLGHPLRWALSNSFAFGGVNATLIMGRE